MTAAVGCSPDQLLYSLSSQADEVAQVAKQLGLSTILAIGQILDHTAARMRNTMHGRTLVEMAVVRICQLDELDDLAAIVAEMRGAVESTGRGGKESRHTTPLPAAAASAPAKKNAEPTIAQTTKSLADTFRQLDQTGSPPATVAGATGFASASEDAASPAHAAGQRRHPLAQSTDAAMPRQEAPHSSNSVDEPSPSATEAIAPAVDSVLAQFQRAMAEGVPPRPAVAQSRPSRREQTAKAAEHPFVRRAIELFDAPPDKLRYTPPEDAAN
jgi:DNA polymerase-3 subunit gamma/tau